MTPARRDRGRLLAAGLPILLGAAAFAPGGFAPGGFAPRGGGWVHPLQVSIHVATSLVVLGIARGLGLGVAAGGIAALVFLLHPAQAEAVAWPTELRSVAATLLLLVGLSVWISARGRRGPVRVLGAYLPGLLATVVHPFAAVHPLLFLGYDRLVGSRDPCSKDGGGRFPHLLLLPAAACAALAGASLGTFEDPLTGLGGGALPLEPTLWGRALEILLLPARLSVLMPPGPPGGGGGPPWIAASVLAVAGAGAFALRRRAPRAVFAALLAFVTLAARAGFLPGDGPALGDRYAHAGIAGLAVGAAVALDPILRGGAAPLRAGVLVACAGVLGLLGVQTFARVSLLGDRVGVWREAASRNPRSPEARLGLGRALLAAARIPARDGGSGGDPPLEGAARAFEDALDLAGGARRPRGVRLGALDGLIEALAALGRPREALDRATQRIEVLEAGAGPATPRGSFARAWGERGGILLGLGRVEEALRDLRTAAAWTPGRVEPWVALARAILEPLDPGKPGSAPPDREGVREGLEAVERALELEPGSLEARLLLGEGLRLQGEYVRAVRAFEAAAALDPASPAPHRHLARLYLASIRDPGEAAREIREALRRDPGDPDSLMLLADVLRAQGRDELADEAVEKGFLADPLSPRVRRRWAEVLLREGREALRRRQPDLARERALAALRAGAAGAAPHLLLAEAEAAGGGAAEASREFERALAADPGSREVRRKAAFFYKDAGYAALVAGRREEARHAFRRAVDLLPGEPAFALIRRLLEGEGE